MRLLLSILLCYLFFFCPAQDIPSIVPQSEIRFFFQRPDSPGEEEVLARPYKSLKATHEEAWAEVWNTSWLGLPEKRAHSIWTRGKYYAMSHFPLIAEKPMLPTGLNSNIWGFTFPQDVYFVAENLPRQNGRAEDRAPAAGH